MNIVQKYYTVGSGTFDGNWYQCLIIGTGRPSHFGPSSQNPEIPEVTVRCFRFSS